MPCLMGYFKEGAFITIDASKLNLTCGIIDEHSHIAIRRGVNEGSQAVTAEVRIGDVINANDINIYRQLSGGVTTSTITVPLVTALGVGLASSIKGRNPMVDGFGLIAFASLTPMIFVMAYGMFIGGM